MAYDGGCHTNSDHPRDAKTNRSNTQPNTIMLGVFKEHLLNVYIQYEMHYFTVDTYDI